MAHAPHARLLLQLVCASVFSEADPVLLYIPEACVQFVPWLDTSIAAQRAMCHTMMVCDVVCSYSGTSGFGTGGAETVSSSGGPAGVSSG